MEVLALIAFAVACGVVDTGKGYWGGITAWTGDRKSQWSNYKKSVRDRRTEKGHRRVRDVPLRVGFSLMELLGWTLLTPARGFLSGWRRRKEAREAWRKRHSGGELDEPTAEDGPELPDATSEPTATEPPDPAPTRPDGRPDLRPVPPPQPEPVAPHPYHCGRCGHVLTAEQYHKVGLCLVCENKPTVTRPNSKGPSMSDVNTLEQLQAAQKAVSDAAQVNFDDKTADLTRAKADLQNAQNLAEQVAAVWPNATATPFRQMVEDAQQAVNAAVAALAAADQRKANVANAAAEVKKQVEAEDKARAAGWKGGVAQAGPVLTG